MNNVEKSKEIIDVGEATVYISNLCKFLENLISTPDEEGYVINQTIEFTKLKKVAGIAITSKYYNYNEFKNYLLDSVVSAFASKGAELSFIEQTAKFGNETYVHSLYIKMIDYKALAREPIVIEPEVTEPCIEKERTYTIDKMTITDNYFVDILAEACITAYRTIDEIVEYCEAKIKEKYDNVDWQVSSLSYHIEKNGLPFKRKMTKVHEQELEKLNEFCLQILDRPNTLYSVAELRRALDVAGSGKYGNTQFINKKISLLRELEFVYGDLKYTGEFNIQSDINKVTGSQDVQGLWLRIFSKDEPVTATVEDELVKAEEPVIEELQSSTEIAEVVEPIEVPAEISIEEPVVVVDETKKRKNYTPEFTNRFIELYNENFLARVEAGASFYKMEAEMTELLIKEFPEYEYRLVNTKAVYNLYRRYILNKKKLEEVKIEKPSLVENGVVVPAEEHQLYYATEPEDRDDITTRLEECLDRSQARELYQVTATIKIHKGLFSTKHIDFNAMYSVQQKSEVMPLAARDMLAKAGTLDYKISFSHIQIKSIQVAAD